MTTITSAGTAVNYSRISGLASGMDIDSMVTDMMKAERIPMDKLTQQKQILEWQQEDYRALNTALYSFKDTVFNTKLESTFDKNNATASNSTVATATAGASAAEGIYAITVNSMAAGVTKGSTAQLADEKDVDGNSLTLYQQFTEFGTRGINETDNITVNINGADLEFDLDTDTISSVVTKINNANVGVKASYDSNLNRFFLTTTSTGSDARITISSDNANFLDNGTNNSILKLNIDDEVVYNGQNASIDFGDAVGLESATNTITVNGLTLNLTAEGSTNITVTKDMDAVVDAIKEFVEAYNNTLSTLNSKVKEERDRDYTPLTDAQKEEMSDSDIEKWETKARAGLLRNDTLLQNIVSNFRGSMTRVVEGLDGQYSSLSQIGITTGSYDENGKLYIDEDKLRAALANDPDGVKELFVNNSSTDDEKGIAYKMYEIASNGIKYIADKAGSTSSFSTVDNSYIGKRLTEMKEDIEDWQDRLDDIEDRYYTQFAAMETAINKMNTQSSWLSAQFSTSS